MKTKKTKENHAETEQAKPFPQSTCCVENGVDLLIALQSMDNSYLVIGKKEGEEQKVVLFPTIQDGLRYYSHCKEEGYQTNMYSLKRMRF
jgi:hypothetical protein